ncbi:MAG: M20/M25/M40 family metallo-hydrolase, partial [Anaerolineae bacterium]|nr:M20/M25/M40 family metallo-hydrolase [Anaerolineae bacterium]
MSVPRNTLEAELKESKRGLPRAVPVQEKERIQLVDIIRGFAVFGILVANMVAFSGQHGGVMTWESWPDRAVVFLTEFLVRAKFYTLFSFLFGWGMSIQLQRAKERGAKFLPVYLRRLIVLLAFGLIHGLFIWSGDILTFYALSGFFLILFRKRSTKLVLTTAVLLLVFNVFLNSPLESAESLRTWYAEATASLRWNIHPESNFQDGTYLEINGRRIQEFVSTNSFMLYFFGPVFSMFLLGMVWGRRGYFRNYLEHKPFFKRLLWIALPLGLLLNGLFASTRVWNDLGWPELISPEYFRIFVVGTRTFGAPLLMLAYVSAFSLLISQPKWGSRFASLAPIGRIALTSYLVQSVVATLIFYNYVWSGLYGEVGPAFSLVITLIIYTSQMRFSKWWLERYQFGPVEWLWRTLSYRQRPPYRHGDTYDTMHPSRWVRRLQEISPGRLLGAVWALLIIWAVILFNAYSELGGPGRAITLGGESPAASATPIPGASIPGQEDPSSSSPEVVVTPEVDPVRYDPGPLAAAGDTLALAQQFDHQVALTHIEALTGAPSFGRYAGTPQGYAAGDYIAEQFAAYGLQPAGEDGTFFQPFPLAFHNLASIPRLVVTDADGASHADYQLHDDYSVIGTAYLGAGAAAGQVFWANNCEPSDFYDVDAAGKIVLCRALSSVESGRYALEHGAAGLLLLTNTDTFPLAFGATYRENWLQETIPALRVSRAVVDDILRGSGLTVDELSLRFDSFDLPAQVQIEVDLSGEEACAAQPCRGRNVLGVIPGRHPDYRDEVVIIGGHYDHLGQSPGGAITWPGANDNASGVAVMLEVARMWQAQGYVPNRTVVFAAWDAEELALLGSRFYVDNPQYPL